MYSKIILDNIYLISFRLGATGLQTIFFLILSNYFGAKVTGEAQTLIAWSLFLGSLISLGLPNYVLKNVAKGGDANSVASNTTSLKMVLGSILVSFIVLIIAIGVILIYDVYNKINFIEKSYDMIVIGFLFANIYIVSDALKAKYNLKISIFIEFYIPYFLLTTGTVVLLISSKGFSIDLIYKLLILSSIISIFISLHVISRGNKIVKGFKKEDIPQIVDMWLIKILNNSAASLPYILFPLIGANMYEIGLFAVAHKLVALHNTIVSTLNSYYSKRFVDSNNNTKLFKKTFLQSQKILIVVSIPYFAFLFLFEGKVLSIFGSEFVSANKIFTILLMSKLISSFFGLTEYAINMSKNPRVENISSIISLFIFLSVLYFIQESPLIKMTYALSSLYISRNLISYLYLLRFIKYV